MTQQEQNNRWFRFDGVLLDGRHCTMFYGAANSEFAPGDEERVVIDRVCEYIAERYTSGVPVHWEGFQVTEVFLNDIFQPGIGENWFGDSGDGDSVLFDDEEE